MVVVVLMWMIVEIMLVGGCGSDLDDGILLAGGSDGISSRL